MSIADKITQLTNIRAAIRQALVNKGISASAHNFSDFAADIAAIATGATLQSKSVTPGASQKTVTPDSGYDGLSQVVVAGDADLVAGNIKSGVDIFGVTGSYAPASVQLQSKSVSPSTSAQTVVADSGYDGLSQVTVAGAPLQTRTVTPTAAGLEVTKSSSSWYGLLKVNVNGDANLVAENIKKDISIFGVTGTYEGSSGGVVNGSLIEITCSTNIDEVTATVNGNTYTATLNTSTHKAYVTIPNTDTTAARTCVLKAFRSGTQLTSAQVSMAAGIGYYTASLETSQRLYYYGTWYGVSNQTWAKTVSTSTVTDNSSGLQFYCPNGNYGHRFTLSPNIDTRGYTHFRIRGQLTGGVNGSSSQTSRGNSYITIGSQFINLPNNTSGTVSFDITSEKYETASSDATLILNVSVPMGYAPATVIIQEIEFV